MTPRIVVVIVLLVLSVAAGLAVGEWFFQLFLKAVPPVALSQFNSQASRVAHLLYGAVVGLLMFVWALLGMAAGGLMRSKPKVVKAV